MTKKRKPRGFSYGTPGHDFGLAQPKTGEWKRARAEAAKRKRLPKAKPTPIPSLAKQGGGFSPERGAAVLAMLQAGHSLEVAAGGAGAHRVTVWRWVQRGRADLEAGVQSELATFAKDYAHAEASALAQAESNLLEHGRNDWRANVRFLEARRPDTWGPKATGPLVARVVDAVLERVRELGTPEEYQRLVEMLSGDIEVGDE